MAELDDPPMARTVHPGAERAGTPDTGVGSLRSTRVALSDLFGAGRALVGMVHLLPLPGSPGWRGSMDEVLHRALTDAETLLAGGVDGVLVENFGDAPFHPGPVPPETVAALARAVAEVCALAGERPVGVNVLRNDARSALGIAAATGAAFIRVNVHVGTMATDQGLLEGRAWETLRCRRALGLPTAILADVHVKHAAPFPARAIGDEARDCWERGGADGLVVSGPRTGAPPEPRGINAVRTAVPDAPVWVGSGVRVETAPSLLARADGAIVGSAFQAEGRAGDGVDPARVAALLAVVGGLDAR